MKAIPRRNNRIVSALLSLLSSAAIWAHLGLSSYEPLLLGIFAALFFLFSAALRQKKKSVVIAGAVLSFVFALFTVLGNLDALIDRKEYMLWCAIRFFGFWSLYYAVLAVAFEKLSAVSLMCEEKRGPAKCTKVFFGSFAVLTVVYFVWWLYEYPGNTSPDTNNQLCQVLGIIPLSSNHPTVSTLFLGLIFKAGLGLFSGSQNKALALYTAVQLLIMAAIYAYVLESLYEKGIKRKVVITLLCVYLLHPIYGSYSVTVWKDVLFSGWITAFCVTLWRMIEKEKTELRTWETAALFVFALAAGLFRNKCYYAFLLLFPFLFVQFRKKSRWVQFMPLIVFSAALLIDGPLFSSLGIRHSDIVESLSIPTQHIARVLTDGCEISENQRELLSHIMDVDAVPEVYNANTSDPIKEHIRKTGDVEYLEQHKSDYLKLWLELGVKYPGAYLRAQIDETKGYWYPDTHFWSMSNHCQASDDLNIYKDRQTPGWLTTILDNIGFYFPLLPFTGLLFSIGTSVWLTLALFALCTVNGRKQIMVVFLPVLLLLLTLFLVTPVFAEFRYSFAMYTTLPLFAVIPFAKAPYAEPDGTADKK